MPRDTPYAGVASIFRSSLAAGEAPQVFEDGGCGACHGGPGWTASRLFFTPSSTTNSELAAAGEIRAQPADADNTGSVIPPRASMTIGDAWASAGHGSATQAAAAATPATTIRRRVAFPTRRAPPPSR